MALHFIRPEWLWTLLPAALLGLWLWHARRQSGGWSTVIAPELLQHLVGDKGATGGASWVYAVILGWMLAALAASGPSWEKIPQPLHQKQDALVLLLDLSLSMKSADLPPTRIDRARQKLLDLLTERREGQTGLVAYAGDAHVVTPLTDDTPTIANLLPALHPDMMPVPGSDAGAAVALGLELLHSAGVRRGGLLLVTDGISEGDRRTVTGHLRGTGVQLDVLGVGTRTGAPIPLPRGGFVREDSGAIVMPGLEEGPLRELAAASQGGYRRMQIDNSDLDALLADNLLADSDDTLALQRSADAWDDKGYLFIFLLLPLVLALFRRGWVLGVVALLSLAEPQQARAQGWTDLWLTPDQQGQRALEAGESAAAAALFEDSNWAGTAAYQSGDYAAAADHFAARDSADSWYNRGNALARAGELQDAIAAYEESLQRAPGREDARDNLELLRRLQQQQQQQQQEQQAQQQSQQGEQQSAQNQQQGQQEQQGQQAGDGEAPKAQQPDSGEPSPAEQRQTPRTAGQDTGEQGAAAHSSGPEDGQKQEQQQPQRAAGERGEPAPPGESPPDAGAMAAAEPPRDRERDQAVEQWLRRVPDDPSGLLREKFRYESERRRERGERRENETYW